MNNDLTKQQQQQMGIASQYLSGWKANQCKRNHRALETINLKNGSRREWHRKYIFRNLRTKPYVTHSVVIWSALWHDRIDMRLFGVRFHCLIWFRSNKTETKKALRPKGKRNETDRPTPKDSIGCDSAPGESPGISWTCPIQLTFATEATNSRTRQVNWTTQKRWFQQLTDDQRVNQSHVTESNCKQNK